MGAGRVAYVIRMFPQLSETFVANEILAVERQGVPLRVFSYRHPSAPVPHECVRLIRARIDYLPDPLYRHPRTLARANSDVYRRDRERYRKTVATLARDLTGRHEPLTWRRFQHAVSLAARVHAERIDHLHAHFAHAATRVAMLASQLTGVPFSFSAHAKDIYTAEPEILARKIRAAEFVMTCTSANRDYLRGLVEPSYREKIKLGYHGIDVGKWARGERKPEADPPLILSVGRMVEKKGFADLLRACSVLKLKGVRFRCAIVGEGPQKPQLEEMIAELGLGEIVTLADACSQEVLIEHYRRATVLALPCQVMANGDRDGIPNVVLEAMAAGVPVVSSAVSGIPEVVRSEENGLLVEQRNPDLLAAALERLLADENLRDRLAAEAGRTVAAQFDAATSGELLANLFTGGEADGACDPLVELPDDARRRVA